MSSSGEPATADPVTVADRVVAAYTRKGRDVVVWAAGSDGLRRAVHGFRHHSASMLDKLGAATWDRRDDSAGQLACVEAGAVIGGIRITGGTTGAGEVFDDFEDLSSLPAGCPAEFVTFSRYLVAPSHRGAGIGTLLAHAASSWSSRTSAVDDLVVTAVQAQLPGLTVLGLRCLTAPRYLGPGAVPVAVMAGKVSDVLERSFRRLAAGNWSVRSDGRTTAP